MAAAGGVEVREAAAGKRPGRDGSREATGAGAPERIEGGAGRDAEAARDGVGAGADRDASPERDGAGAGRMLAVDAREPFARTLGNGGGASTDRDSGALSSADTSPGGVDPSGCAGGFECGAVRFSKSTGSSSAAVSASDASAAPTACGADDAGGRERGGGSGKRRA